MPPYPKIETQDLTREVDGEVTVNSVSLAVEKSEVLGIIGPSGAGKSSFLRLLNRLDEPTSGTVLLEGVDYREIPPQDLRHRVGYVPQQSALRTGSVYENVTIGPRLRREEIDGDKVERLLSRVDLSGYASRDVDDLSGGEAQRVAIARTVLNEPEVLLLDEPTSSLDSEAEAMIEDMIDDLISDYGLTCILVTHDHSQARRLADRVAVFEEGSVAQVGSVDEVIV